MGGASGAVAFAMGRVVVTGVRGTTTPPASSVIQLHNGGAASVQVMGLALSGTDQALFKITNPTTFPATVMAGADLPVTVDLVTTGAGLPAAPTDKNLGSNLMTANLTATLSSGTATALVYGLLQIQANYESTLGQILTTLGYNMNVGKAQKNWNPNTSMNAMDLPGVEAGTDEVPAQHFTKAGSGNVTMTLVARFSPYGALPFGWYAPGSSTKRNMVGTMSDTTDPQTNNKARMVFPPPGAGSSTTFDPGTAPFALWVYSDQSTGKFESGGKPANGDYDYSEDSLNSPANVHRYKTYPLKDEKGTMIPQQYMVAVEEAGNGDYQDYVFILGNVTPAP